MATAAKKISCKKNFTMSLNDSNNSSSTEQGQQQEKKQQKQQQQHGGEPRAVCGNVLKKIVDAWASAETGEKRENDAASALQFNPALLSDVLKRPLHVDDISPNAINGVCSLLQSFENALARLSCDTIVEDDFIRPSFFAKNMLCVHSDESNSNGNSNNNYLSHLPTAIRVRHESLLRLLVAAQHQKRGEFLARSAIDIVKPEEASADAEQHHREKHEAVGAVEFLFDLAKLRSTLLDSKTKSTETKQRNVLLKLLNIARTDSTIDEMPPARDDAHSSSSESAALHCTPASALRWLAYWCILGARDEAKHEASLAPERKKQEATIRHLYASTPEFDDPKLLFSFQWRALRQCETDRWRKIRQQPNSRLYQCVLTVTDPSAVDTHSIAHEGMPVSEARPLHATCTYEEQSNHTLHGLYVDKFLATKTRTGWTAGSRVAMAMPVRESSPPLVSPQKSASPQTPPLSSAEGIGSRDTTPTRRKERFVVSLKPAATSATSSVQKRDEDMEPQQQQPHRQEEQQQRQQISEAVSAAIALSAVPSTATVNTTTLLGKRRTAQEDDRQQKKRASVAASAQT